MISFEEELIDKRYVRDSDNTADPVMLSEIEVDDCVSPEGLTYSMKFTSELFMDGIERT